MKTCSALALVLSCLALGACDGKSDAGSSDGAQNAGGETASASPVGGRVSHAADGGSHAGARAAAGGGGGRAGSGATAADDVDAGMEPQAGHGEPAAGAGGQVAQAGHGGKGGHGGVAGTGSAAHGGSGGQRAAADRCGTRGGVTCGADAFCNFEPDQDCGGTDRGGQCEPKPGSCNATSAPVCGCDGHSYDDACQAHRAGVSVKRDGLCGSEECDAAGGVTVTSDGASTPKCPNGEMSFPIRGKEMTLCCLQAARAGKTCGGIGSLECGGDEFCNYEKDAGGQGCDGRVADAAGVCQSRPAACTREYRAVCGCDHHSYGNACEAHRSGAAVMHDGECTEAECKAVAGRVVVGTGPAPMCDPGESSFGAVAAASGQMPVEGQICCVHKP